MRSIKNHLRTYIYREMYITFFPFTELPKLNYVSVQLIICFKNVLYPESL